MSKSKSVTPNLLEIHFMSSLPLEESLRMLEGLASDTVTVDLTQTGADLWQFNLWRMRSGGAVIRGTLRRWEGTFTRVDCQSYARRSSGLYLVPAFVSMLVGGWLMCSLPPDNVAGLVTLTLATLVITVILTTLGFLKLDVTQRDTSAAMTWFIEMFWNAGDMSQHGHNLFAFDDPGVDSVLNALEAERMARKRG